MSTSGRVIIVDDNKYSAEMLEELLQAEGYTVDKAANGDQALALISSCQPDLILLDARLPDIDAFALRAKLQKNELLRDVPVIFMSADDDAEMRLKGVELGDDHFTKPFVPREVLTRVERQVTVSQVRMALRESEAKFQSVMESAIDAIISADISGVIRSWNRAAAALFGYSAGEAIGRPLELIIPRQYHQAHQEGIKRVGSGGATHAIGKTVELSAIRKGGIEFPIELSLATWFLDEDRYYTGIIRDISERKQAEQKFRSVTESAIDAIISADQWGVVVSWNSAATAILGYSSEEAIGQPLEIIIPERHHEAHRTGMKRITDGGESRVIGSTVELHARTKAGNEIPIELSLATWTVHEDRYFTGIIRDISERKEAETSLKNYAEELARQHEELKLAQSQLIDTEKQAALGRLLAGLLHEVNSPLGALQSSASSIGTVLNGCRDYIASGNGSEDPAARQTLDGLDIGDQLAGTMKTSARRIQKIFENLKHLVSIDGAERKKHDIREGLQTVLTLLEPQLQNGISVRRSFPEQPVEVLCDPARLNQAFLNVIQNAIEVLKDHGNLRVTMEPRDNLIEVIIDDDGPGMTAEQINRAFDFSFSEKDGRVRLSLGLATSRRTVEEVGGKLDIESRQGHGTRVHITLPLT
ncbi:MAG: PAS domain S-box protein [candidate division Zixibacteria bacterium]|nr:PAS domain S-box protein [candidate division Zixibacteria bacterium]MDH3936640.1 PAS domain S-box protein [candidate division Zixibacteria bacterium]MDH4034185.1 PAS domain S-box protein [candidate division Zixibacteria bacterium]